MRKKVLQEGQALVLVLLSLAVVLTIVLFILSRSITDIAVSSRSEEAVRAFSAAEAGIENALVIGSGTTSGIGCDQSGANCTASYNSNVTGYADKSPDFNYPIPMYSGDSMITWFVSHDENGNLICDGSHHCFAGTQMYVCWGDPSKVSNPVTDPAIEVSVFYETTPMDLTTIKIARLTADSEQSRAQLNKFESPGIGTGCPNGASYAHSKLYTFANRGIPCLSCALAPGNLQFARIRMLYNTDTAQPLGITVVGDTLPSQGQDITSTGTAGQSNRKVEVYQSWPEPPPVFDYAIYSGTGLTK